MSSLPIPTFDILIEKLKKNTLINLFGSFIYIILRFIFYTALFRYIDKTMYGSMGYFFSYIFLMVNLASAPTLYIPTHMIHTNNKNIASFIQLITLHIFLLGASFIFFVSHVKTIQTVQELLIIYPSLLFIISLLIFFEGIRLLLRFCMHLINKTYIIVPVELASMVIYMAFVFYFLITSSSFSLYHIFIPFLIDSIIITFYFLFLFIRWLLDKEVASDDCFSPEKVDINSRKEIFFDSLAHSMSFYAQALLSDNMIIVSFMPSLGLAQVALPKFAAYIAESVRILIRSLVKFSMIPALFAIKREPNQSENKKAKKLFISYAKKTFLHILGISLSIIILFLLGSYLFPEIFFQDNSLFFSAYFSLVTLFLIAKYIDQWNFFYEKIILAEGKPFPIITIAFTKIILAICLYVAHISLTKTLLLLVAIKIITALFSYFYAKKII
ncbi:hypothetical protein JKY79_03685 [Candidatus Babeliales bacterium]|nr:hypothetical protein [Candidatus Babeliales bacterium]